MSETAYPTGRRRLGGSSATVSPFGIGTAALGGWPSEITAADAQATISRAVDLGLALVDTAPMYGHGRSERNVGAAVAGRPRESYVITTKVGRLLRADAPLDPSAMIDGKPLFAGPHAVNPVFDFSHDATLRSLEESLVRLGLDRVDAAYIHDPDNHYDEAMSGAYPALARLRDEGVVRAIGVGMNQTPMLARFAREGDFDCFLVAGRYTLLEQDALDDLVAIRERGCSLVLGGVLNSGLLADPGARATYNYAPALPAVLARARALHAVCARHEVPLAAAAQQFAAALPGAAAVLVGATSVAQVEASAELVSHPIPSDLWAELKDEGLVRADAPVPLDAAVRDG